jgi:thymidylate synthase (FAD)
MITAKLVDVMGNDLEVVKAAKVSFDNDADVEPQGWYDVDLECVLREQPILTDAQKNLIKYLVRGMTKSEYLYILDNPTPANLWKWRTAAPHAAPFGHCFLSFVIEAPVFVARHAVKTEYLRMSEVSRRYIKGEPVYFKPDQWSGIADNVKQGAGDYLDKWGQNRANLAWLEAVHTAGDEYDALLHLVAPEEARMVLPLCHMTRWRWSGSLDAFMNMLKMRLDPHTQSQTRLLAGLIADKVKQAFPVSYASYVEGDIL